MARPLSRLQSSSLSLRAASAALALLAGCAVVGPPQVLPGVPQSQSVAEADRKLALVARERAQAEAAFAAGEQQCYAKFLVNHCLDGARERHRGVLARLRAIEIEAEHFKRKAAVDERDRALAKEERNYQAERARMAAALPPAAPALAPGAALEPASGAPATRQAAAMKRRAAQAQAGAARRAASVAAFEKRKRESAQRLREIAQKKAAPKAGQAR